MNFQQMSLAELEQERRRLIGEIKGIDAQTEQGRDNPVRKMQDEIRELIERLVNDLLPNLFQPTLDALKKTFPNEQQLTGVLPEKLMPRDNSLWGAIKRMLGRTDNPHSQNLERQRILLRNILWNLSKMPPDNGKFQYLFLLLLQKKQELAAVEKNSQTNDLTNSDLLLRRQRLAELLRECEAEIARRNKRTDQNDYFERHEQEVYDRRTTYEPDYFPDTTSSNASEGTDYSSNENFEGFGGGGDFAGGGAGGNWDNYS